MTQQHRWLALALGMGLILVGSAGCRDKNRSSSEVKTAYSIPHDKRTPLIRTYRQRELDEKTPEQLQAIKQAVLGSDGENPLLEFKGQPQPLNFSFTVNNQQVTPAGDPALLLTAKEFDDHSHVITKRYHLAKTKGSQYQVRLTDLFAKVKLTTQYNVVASYLLELHFKLDHVNYVTFTAFTTGH